MAEDTLPKLLRRNFIKYGDKKIAMRAKDFGIWNEYTWKDYYEKAEYFCMGIVSLGLERGDKVSIIGDNDPEWVWAALGISTAGGIIAGLFVDVLPREIEYIVLHSDSKFVMAKDQEQVDKVLSIKEKLPAVKKIIYWDIKGLWDYDEPDLMSFEDVIQLGKDYKKTHPHFFEDSVDMGKPDDIHALCYSSGTTGAVPNAAMITHRNLIAYHDGFFEANPKYENDNWLSYEPTGWISIHIWSIADHLGSGMIIDFPEGPETVQENTREIAPEQLFYGARMWEGIVSDMRVRMEDNSWLKKLCIKSFLLIGYKEADCRLEGRKPSFFLRVAHFIGWWLAFRPLLDKYGLVKTKSCLTAGAPLGPDLFRFLCAVGLNMRQAYGLSEVPIFCAQKDDGISPDTVGTPLKGMTVRISDEGEILTKGDIVFAGYYKDPELTAERLVDGWFHTGDAGYLRDDGSIVFLERVTDLGELANGQKYAPQYIEGRLKFSPYIKDCLVVGGQDKEYIGVIINIDFNTIGKWAEARSIPYTTFADLSQRPEVQNLIRGEVEEVNRLLPVPPRIKKYVLLHKEFDPDEAELTRTRKIRRKFMEDRYNNLIEAVYTDNTEVEVRASVKYRDGREAVISVPLKITTVETEEGGGSSSQVK